MQKDTKHRYKTKKQISETRKKRFREGKIIVWNKGKKNRQVSWAKGLTKETDLRIKKLSESLMGHGVTAATRKKMSIAAKKRAT